MAKVRTLKKLPTQVIINRCVFARQRKLFDGLPLIDKTKVFDEQFNKSVAALTR